MADLTTRQRELVVQLTELSLADDPQELEAFRLVSGSLVELNIRKSATDHADDVLFFDGVLSTISEIIVGIIVALCSDLLKQKIAVTASSLRRAFEKKKDVLLTSSRSAQMQKAVGALEKALDHHVDAEPPTTSEGGKEGEDKI